MHLVVHFIYLAAIGKAEEAKNKINSINQELKTSTETVDKAKTRYAELAQEVENLGKVNQSQGTLTTDEYEEFLDLSNQLAEVFPQLRVGFDENSNSILNLSGSVNTIIDSLDALIQKEKEMANIEMMKQMPDVYDGYIEELKDAKEKKSKAQEEYDKLQYIYLELMRDSTGQVSQAFNINGRRGTYTDQYGKEQTIIQYQYIDMLDSLGLKYTEKYMYENGKTVGVNVMVDGDFDLSSVKSKLKEVTDELDYAKDNLESKTSSFSTYLNTWLQSEFIYTQIDNTGLQTAMQDMILNFDFSSLPDNIDTWEKAEEYLRNNILFAIKKTKDNPEVSGAISQIFSNSDSLSPEDFKRYYEIIKKFFGDEDPITLYLKPQFEEAGETEKLINDTAKNFDDEEGLKKFFSENGINTKDEVNEFNNLTKGITNTDEAIEKWKKHLSDTAKPLTRSEMITSLNGLSEGFEELDKIYSSIQSDDAFDFKLLDDEKFKENFEGLGDVYADFIETVTSNPDDIGKCRQIYEIIKN